MIRARCKHTSRVIELFPLLTDLRIDEVMFENELKEGPCSRTASINELSFSPQCSPRFTPAMTFESDFEEEYAAQNSELETRRHSYSSSATEGDFHDFDLDDEDENDADLNLNSENAAHLLSGDIQLFSPTQKFAESLRNSTILLTPPSPEPNALEEESRPKSAMIDSENGRLHARSSSGCSDSSTLQGSEHGDEEFPMRKDGNEDVIHVIEIPLKSPGRRRGSSLFGTIKHVVRKM
jgi:hypothetical protein